MGEASMATVARMICTAQRANLRAKYGPRGQTPLAYHNAEHSVRDVLANAKLIARELVVRGELDQRDIILLDIAATFHDDEQRSGPGENERLSADAAECAMRQHPRIFTERDILRVRHAILSTTVEFSTGIPRQILSSRDPLAIVLADADLASLARPEYLDRALRLVREIEHQGGRLERDATPSKQQVTAFLVTTLSLIQAKCHPPDEYHHDVSRKLFGPGLLENARHLTTVIRGLREGDLTVDDVQKLATSRAARQLGVA